MKKIMFAAAAVALAGVASAANVFDYKASVKAVDLKSVKGFPVKVVKSNTLTGYLVTRPGCPCEECGESCATKVNSFLVLRNKRTMPKYGDRSVRLLPANLLAKVWATKEISNGKKATLEAEGYLFAGDNPNATFAMLTANYEFGAANESTESAYLLGQYNIPSEAGSFFETWLYAAGFGKGYSGGAKDNFCAVGNSNYCLKNLKGSVIGGSYVCRVNYFGEWFLCLGWNGTTDVVSGTWSIKENTKVGANAGSITSLINAAGYKLDKNFGLLAQVDPTFIETWIAE